MMKIVEQSRRTLSKNLIHHLPVQDPKGKKFQRPALPFAGAHISASRHLIVNSRNKKKIEKLQK